MIDARDLKNVSTQDTLKAIESRILKNHRLGFKSVNVCMVNDLATNDIIKTLEGYGYKAFYHKKTQNLTEIKVQWAE